MNKYDIAHDFSRGNRDNQIYPGTVSTGSDLDIK